MILPLLASLRRDLAVIVSQAPVFAATLLGLCWVDHLFRASFLRRSLARSEESKLLAGEPCGFRWDCPRNYTAEEVQAIVAQMHQDLAAKENARIMDEIHGRAREACGQGARFLDTGGWCYSSPELQWGGMEHIDTPYELPDLHFPFDDGFASKLVTRVLGDAGSVTDLGAGVGQAGHSLRWYLPSLQYYGYDGGGNVDEFTHGFVNFVDLTRPVSLRVSDWVLSTEVGEHIPNEFEKVFVANIHAHNCKGVILTWAVLDQGGAHHVNNHGNAYIRELFTELGYEYQDKLSQELRASWSLLPWLMNTIMVFKRTAVPSFCAPHASSASESVGSGEGALTR